MSGEVAQHSAGLDAVAAPGKYLTRQQTLLRLFFATYWLVVFTGAIRKWLFPTNQIFYLLQDIPLAIAYLYALWTGLFTRFFLALGVASLCAVLIAHGLLQVVLIDLPIKVLVIGLHNYIFYLPMLLIFPLAMTAEGRKKYIRWNLLLNLPMTLLVVAQSRSSATAFINRTTALKGFGGLGGDLARGTGTFNFVSFYALWLAIVFALCMGEWLIPQERRACGKLLLVASTLGALLSTAVSGERSSLGYAAIVMVVAIFAAATLRAFRPLMITGGILLFAPGILLISAILSPTMLRAFEARTTNAGNVQNSKGRILNLLTGFIPQRFDPLGAGLGEGSDAAHVGEIDAYQVTYTLDETDLPRTIDELGTFTGSFYDLMRMGMAVGVVLLGVYLLVWQRYPHPLLLSVMVCMDLYIGDLTRNSTMTATQTFLAASFVLGALYFPQINLAATPNLPHPETVYA